MSTDQQDHQLTGSTLEMAIETSYTPNRKKTPKLYIALQHPRPDINGKPQHPAVQIVRHRDGFDLPHRTSSKIRREWASKYKPGTVGAKQLARVSKLQTT